MMNNRKINLFLISICLLGVLALATNALLVVHLAACDNEHESHSEHDSHQTPKPTHDHSHCPLCQVFLGASGKYIAGAMTIFVFIETRIIF